MRFIVQTSASMDGYALDCQRHRLDACILRSRSNKRRLSHEFDACSGGCYHHNAGWSSPVARWAHNPKVGGSNPPPATNNSDIISTPFLGSCGIEHRPEVPNHGQRAVARWNLDPVEKLSERLTGGVVFGVVAESCREIDRLLAEHGCHVRMEGNRFRRGGGV